MHVTATDEPERSSNDGDAASRMQARDERCEPLPGEPAIVVSRQPPALRAWKLVVAYDGTDFRGWQVQPGLRTVQGELARAVQEVTGERVLPQGSGRTDTGVHAEAQAVSMELRAAIPRERLLTALNRRLPPAIRVVQASVLPGFHARSSVLQKTYEYRIVPRHNGEAAGGVEEIVPPWQARFVWDCRTTLLLEAMQAAAATLVGAHDFTSFAAHDPDRATRLAGPDHAGSNVRMIFASTCTMQGGLLLYRVTGNGFLHHMVRNLVGTLVEIGAGRKPAAWMAEVLAAQDRRAAGPTAPPQGLFLIEVLYDQAAGTLTAADEQSLVTC